MDFEIDANDQNIPISLNYQELWIIPSDNNSMDNNDEYFGWTNELKLDEDKFEQSSNSNPTDSNNKPSHKRKLSATSDESVKIKTVSGYKPLKDPLASLDPAEKSSTIKKTMLNTGSSRMPTWQVEDIADLNADLEGLGGDISNNSYNMNDAILSLSGSPPFKQEALSPNSNEATAQQIKGNLSRNINSANNPSRSNDGNNNQNIFNHTLHHLLGASSYSSLHNTLDGNMITSSQSLPQDNYNVTSSSSTFGEDCRFQYVLAAATSIATKVNEDTLTYLNQGQSYEIKLKKLGDLSTCRGKIFKSIIRICFHERRLQYMEREQMCSWQKSRPGDRILEIDVPLSYGLCDVIQPANALNVVVFSWDPTKEVGVYIKVNCISTEFTPKKHGGEKGVPFRIQIETYQVSDRIEISKRLHAAACQIKVFKLKGADRKHKQDKEKILKRPILEQEKFQPSYDCTVLNDIPFEAVVSSPLPESTSNNDMYSPERGATPPNSTNQVDEVCLTKVNSEEFTAKVSVKNPIQQNVYSGDQLLATSNPSVTAHWLTINRFEKYLPTFQNFGGADMFRMSRDDFIQICGHADGIRLYNALHSKAIAPKLTLYVCRDNSTVFNAIFLSTLNNTELLKKLSELVGISQEQVRDIYMQGPQSIHVQLNNDVLQHIKDETMFLLKVLQDNGNCIFVLKPIIK